MVGFSGVSDLVCEEDIFCLNEDDEMSSSELIYSQPLLIPVCELGYEDDYVRFLVRKEKETNFRPKPVSGSWLTNARMEAISWFFFYKTQLGLRNQTAYLSVTYFDRYLQAAPIDEEQLWVTRLLSIACLSVAVKMGETKDISLIMYTTNKDYCFHVKDIQKMELLVLTTLGWNLRVITPFSYLHYISKQLGDHGTKLDQLISRSIELIMAIIKEINLMDYRPSVIAASAVLAAKDWQLTQQALKGKMSTVSLLEWGNSENEQLLSCYNIMQRLSLERDSISTPNSTDQTASPNPSFSAVGTKRRLEFADSDGDLDTVRRKLD